MKIKLLIILSIINFSALGQSYGEEIIATEVISENEANKYLKIDENKISLNEEEVIKVTVLSEQDLIDLEEEPIQIEEKLKEQELSYVIYTKEELKQLTDPELRDRDLETELEQLNYLESKTVDKWATYIDWMNSPEWVADQADLGLAGTIYQKGWIGPRVSRQIVPGKNNGWLVVDAVTLGPNLLVQSTSLITNILFHQVFPYAQGGVIKEKSFVNIRHRDTYEAALTTKPFTFTKIPLTTSGFDKIENGEVLSTVSTGGVFARIGGGILDLLGIELPLGFNIGPRVKLEVKKSLKLNVSKIDKNNILISIEEAKSSAKGFGIGFGIFFDDLLDIPVTLSVNTRNGWSPLVINYKVQKRKTKSIVFKVDISTKLGKKAYYHFIKRDFTLLEELASKNKSNELVYDQDAFLFDEEGREKIKSPVQIEMIKEGQIVRSEFNAAINLILFRSGFRNIFLDAKYNTTTGNGKRFSYEEVSREYIKDSKWFSGDEDSSEKYSVLIPLREDGELVTIRKAGFVLDSSFNFADTKTSGRELIEISKEMTKSGNQLRLPIKINPDKNYGNTQIGLSVRFTALAMKTILQSSEDEIFVSVGSAIGLPDPYVLESAAERQNYISRAKSSSAKNKRRSLIRSSKKQVLEIIRLQDMNNMSLQGRELLKLLFKKNSGDVLHKTLIDLAGQDKVIIKGHIRGRHF